MLRSLAALGFVFAVALPAWSTDRFACEQTAGKAAVTCLGKWLGAIEVCRAQPSASCEVTARADGGPVKTALATASATASVDCDDATATLIGYQDVDDVALRAHDACGDWGQAFLDLTWSATPGLTGRTLSCQRVVAKSVGTLRKAVIAAYGPRCYLREADDQTCRRTPRDRGVKRATAEARRRIAKSCGDHYTALGLDPVEDLLTRATTLARHFAQIAYPPNDLGPTAELGPYPVGLRTIDLFDDSRLNVQGTGPRPVTIEVYYPTTPEAVAGVPRDIAQVLGVPVATVPAWRDVALRPGTYPLITFSHGNNGIRIQSFFFGAHLASHGYIVVSADHHGNTFPDTLAGIVDPNVGANRPRDISFVIDEMLAFNGNPASLFYGAIDPDEIGASGHSFGGYTTFALGGDVGPFGSFKDPRVKALFPQAPAAPFDEAFFQSIDVPTLIVGGSIDETTPFAENQQRPFDLMPSGAAVVGVGKLADAGHFTFSDFCEVDRALLGFLGGFGEACEPRHLPFRHAHDIVNYLALNFFDATLQGDAAALGRLDPATVATIEDLTFTRK